MQPDTATKRPRGRPFGSRNRPRPTTADKMADALRVWRCDLDRPDAVRGVLRLAGFGLMDITRHVDEAVAAIQSRPGRRLP